MSGDLAGDDDKLLGPGVGERAQQDAVDEREGGCRRTDSDRQQADDACGEERASSNRSKCLNSRSLAAPGVAAQRRGAALRRPGAAAFSCDRARGW